MAIHKAFLLGTVLLFVCLQAVRAADLCSEGFKQRLERLTSSVLASNTKFESTFNQQEILGFTPTHIWDYVNLYDALEKEGVVSFLFFGGSTVKGRMCFEGTYGKEIGCAYPRRLTHMLNFLFSDASSHKLVKFAPGKRQYSLNETEAVERSKRLMDGFKVRSINRAVGSVTTSSALQPMTSMLNVDAKDKTIKAVFVDYSANDGSQGKTLMHLPASEVLIRHLREQAPDKSLFFVESVCHEHASFYHDAKVNLTRHYQCPLVSYRRAVGGPENCAHPDIWGESEYLHPPAHIHERVAFTILQALFSQLPAYCDRKEGLAHNAWPQPLPGPLSLDKLQPLPSPLSSEEELEKGRVCDTEGMFSAYDLFGKTAGQPLPGIRFYDAQGRPVGEGEGGTWALKEDREDKPGWISEVADTVVRFRMKFGYKASLRIAFLTSYENIGTVALSMREADEREEPADGARLELPTQEVVLSGKALLKYSQVSSFSIEVFRGGLDEGLNMFRVNHGWEVKPNKEYDVFIRNLENEKFKLVYIGPC